MKSLKINDNFLKDAVLIGSGYESDIFLKDEIVYKIFNENILNVDLKVKSKINKLNFLYDQVCLESTSQPLFLLTNSKDEFIGYAMKYYKEKTNVNDYMLSNADLDTKIELYQEIERNTLLLAQNNIFVIDNNFRNYMITEENQLLIMDIDSISTPQHETECYPTYFFDYYYTRFNDKLDYDFVKYTLALQFLSSINRANREEIRYYTKEDDIVINQLINIFDKYDLYELKNFFNNNKYEKSLGKILIKH